MAKFAELPDGNLVEFPDDWTEGQMDEAVTRDFGHLLSDKPVPAVQGFDFKRDLNVPDDAGAVDYITAALQAPAAYAAKFTQNVSPGQALDTAKATGDDFMPWIASIPARAKDAYMSLGAYNDQKRAALRRAGEAGIFPNATNPDFGFTPDLDAIATDPRIAQERQTIDFTDQERAGVRAAATGENPYLQDLFDVLTSAEHLAPSMALAPVAPGLALTTMSAGKGAEEFRPRTKAGENPGQAALGSLFKSATELTEKVPLGVILDPAMPFAKKLLASMVTEYGQEFATSVMDSMYDKATIDPNMTWEQLLAQANKEGWMGAVTGPVVSTVMQPAVKAQEAYQNRQEEASFDKARQDAALKQVLSSLRPDPTTVDPNKTRQRADQVGPPAAATLNAEVPLPEIYTDNLPKMLRPQEDGMQVDVPRRTDVPPFLKPQAPAEAMPEIPAEYTTDLPKMLRPQEEGLQVAVPETGTPAITKPQAPAEAMPEIKPEEMVVSHGTPHEWAPEPGFPNGRPRLDKIGTGEGAQAFGWGFYTAESGGTATSYQKQLTERSFINKVKDSYDEDYGPDDAAQALRENSDLNQSEHALLDALEKDDWLGFDYPHQAVSAILRNPENYTDVSPETKAAIGNFGRMYKLDVPDDAVPYMLDWDKPLSEQSEAVQNALAKFDSDMYSKEGADYDASELGQSIYLRIAERFKKPEPAPGWDSVSVDHSEHAWSGQKGASEYLAKKGIVGVRYLDATSRKRGAGTSNFVIWDQPTLDRATMLEKNGKPVAQPESEQGSQMTHHASITIPASKTPAAKINTKPVTVSKIMAVNANVREKAYQLSPALRTQTKEPNVAQARVLAQSLGSLAANGLPLNAVSAFTAGVLVGNAKVVKLGSHIRAPEHAGDRSLIMINRGVVNTAVTETNALRIETTEDLDWLLAHELGHAVDFNGDFEQKSYGKKRMSIAYTSGLFESAEGSVYDELVQAWESNTLGLKEPLGYPVAIRYNAKNPPDFVARELFAQAFALYYTRGRLSPEAMQSALPRTYALMEAVHNALVKNQNGTFGSIGQAVRRAFQDADLTPAQPGVRPSLAPVTDTDSTADGTTESPADGGFPPVPEAPPRGPDDGGNGDVTPPADTPLPPIDTGPSINFTVPDETVRDSFVRTFQDKLHRVYIAQKAIKDFAQTQGRDIDIHADVWAAEETISGRVEMDLRVLEEDHINPLILAMRDMGVSQETLDTYLLARHAEERNNVIATRRTDMPDGGSGMTTQEANDTIAEIEQEYPDIEQLAQRVWNILTQKRQLLTETSLLAQDDLDAWEDQYKHYVPLKGMAADALESGKSFTPRGLSTKGRESRAAAGRTSLPASPLVNTIHDMTMAVIRARRNYVGQALMRLVQQNPNQDYWQVFSPTQPDYTTTVVEGAARRVPVDMRHNNDYFGVKFEGKQYYIKLKDPVLKQAMQDLGVERQNVVIRAMNQVTRYIATVNTAYDLAFGPTNFLRDVQAAVYNIMAEQDLHDGRVTTTDLTWTFAKTLRPSFRSINRALHRKAPRQGNVLDQHAADFLEDGAKAGYYNTLDIAGQQRRIESLIKDANGGLLANAKKGLRAVDDVVSDYNATIENATRLAAYSAARTIMETAGVPSVTARKKAAHLAKNLTVNFSRRGEMSSVFNGLYAFFNVTFQGGAQFTRTLGTLKKDPVTGKKSLNAAQKVALVATGWAVAQSILNEMMSDDDDDGRSYYSKIPQHVRERNMIFIMPDGKNYKTLPLAYGYNLFHLLGTITGDVSQRLYAGEDGAWLFVRAILGSFSPLGSPSSDGERPSEDITKMVSPTLTLPIAEIGFNSNFFGERIWAEDKYNDRTPESSGNINAPENLVRMSQWLNEVTGGSMYEKGRIDIAADKFQHWIEFATGGPGRIVSQVDRLTKAVESGEDIPASAVPFLYRFNKEPQKNRAQEYYYENRAIVLAKMDAIRGLRGAERTEYREQNKEFLDLIRAVRAADNKLQGLRKRREIDLSRTTDPVKQAQIRKLYNTRMEAEYNVVNRKWVQQIEKAQ